MPLLLIFSTLQNFKCVHKRLLRQFKYMYALFILLSLTEFIIKLYVYIVLRLGKTEIILYTCVIFLTKNDFIENGLTIKNKEKEKH